MNAYCPKHFNLPRNYIFPGDPTLNVEPYIFTERIVIAIDVALATKRPLLVAGPPGCGKSRLADALAALLGWNFLAKSMTSRTRLEELTVEVDHLRRLHDAHRGNNLLPDAAYHSPGVFWWVFRPDTARWRGMQEEDAKTHGIELAFPGQPRPQADNAQNCVLLIDEIDKAEPDLPNDLLEPLDRRSFGLPDGRALEANPNQGLFTLITTNGERELPEAFLRRCVNLRLEEPDMDGLVAIAKKHFQDAEDVRMRAIAERTVALREEAQSQLRRAPGTSEYLDAVRACRELGVDYDPAEDSVWTQVERAVLRKHADDR